MTLDECRVKTQQHIERVRYYIRNITDRLTTRGVNQDKSKLDSPEVDLFAEYTEKLSSLDYGSEEYAKNLEALKPALDHHYATNRHHPEHFANGVSDMSLIDLIEMICDWKASSERQLNGNLLKSIEVNAKRFNISDQLKQILINTAKILDEIEN